MVTRIVVAEDHQLVRAGITAIIDNIPDVEVVGEATDGAEAVKRVTELNPDILFLDLVMPIMTEITVATPPISIPLIIELSITSSGCHVIGLSPAPGDKVRQ